MRTERQLWRPPRCCVQGHHDAGGFRSWFFGRRDRLRSSCVVLGSNVAAELKRRGSRPPPFSKAFRCTSRPASDSRSLVPQNEGGLLRTVQIASELEPPTCPWSRFTNRHNRVRAKIVKDSLSRCRINWVPAVTLYCLAHPNATVLVLRRHTWLMRRSAAQAGPNGLAFRLIPAQTLERVVSLVLATLIDRLERQGAGCC